MIYLAGGERSNKAQKLCTISSLVARQALRECGTEEAKTHGTMYSSTIRVRTSSPDICHTTPLSDERKFGLLYPKWTGPSTVLDEGGPVHYLTFLARTRVQLSRRMSISSLMSVPRPPHTNLSGMSLKPSPTYLIILNPDLL